jgi:hypothetical protein
VSDLGCGVGVFVDCDCACHDDFHGEPETIVRAHDGRTCADYQLWLDGEVYVRLSSLQNVTYRHDVSTGLTRREWLDAVESDRGEAVADAVLNNVEATVFDDPLDD